MNTETTEIEDRRPTRLSQSGRARLLQTEGGPFLINDWEQAVFVHYEVDPEFLQPLVPFELDLRDGKAYVSMVSFTMRRLRTGFGGNWTASLLSPIATQDFLNVRTYIRHNGEPGIYFLAEWLSNRLSVLLGPWTYGLPYRFGRLEYQNDWDVRYLRGEVESRRTGRWSYRATIDPLAELQPCGVGSLEHFLMERYTAFTDKGCRLGFFRIGHEPWQQTPIKVTVEEDSLPAVTGEWFERARLVGANFSPGVREVWIGRPRFVATPPHPSPSLSPKGRGNYPALPPVSPTGNRLGNSMATPQPTQSPLLSSPLGGEDQGEGYRPHTKSSLSLLAWIPLLLFPSFALALRPVLPAWAFMWTLAAAIWAGCKWLTFARHGGSYTNLRRSLGYLLLWPGMDACAFSSTSASCPKPKAHEWNSAIAKTAMGAALLWGATRFIPGHSPLLVGWVGMFGLIFLLHFGVFHLLALIWQSKDVNVRPLMRTPMSATSLGEFWGKRWNTAFSQLAHELLFASLRRRIGLMGASLSVFVVSGLIHDLVISLPARGGYGLPTAYFLLQGVGVALERSDLGRRMGLGRGLPGWLFVLFMTAAPAFWLFHPPFVKQVIIPFMKAIGAL